MRAIRLAVGVAFAALAIGASPSLAVSKLTTADEQINRLTTRAGTRRAPFLNRDRTRVWWNAEINPNPLKALPIRGEFVSGRDDMAHPAPDNFALAQYQISF